MRVMHTCFSLSTSALVLLTAQVFVLDVCSMILASWGAQSFDSVFDARQMTRLWYESSAKVLFDSIWKSQVFEER